MDSTLGRTLLSPLLIRPGSRYRCFGDGLCCTDIHALGPLDESEKQRLVLVSEHAVHHNHLVDADVLSTGNDGECVFLSEEGCTLHLPLSGALKPIGCSRYPIGLTATPLGARVILEHRCPCTLLGDAPKLTKESVHEHFDPGGDLGANHIVHAVPLDDGELSLEAYVAIETPLLEALDASRSEEAMFTSLGTFPFPPIEHDWDRIAGGMCSVPIRDAGGRFEAALHWFGDALKRRRTQTASVHPRPWSDAFDRAEARSKEAEPLAPFRTFVADHIWSLLWTSTGTLRTMRQELVSRLSIGFAIAKTLREEGTRADRAAAEAVMILDVVGASDWWQSVIAEIDRS